MIKTTKIVIQLLCFLFFSALHAADGTLEWQLGSTPEFIEEAKKLLNSVKPDPDDKGIRQLLFRSEIELRDETIVNHVKKVWYFNDAISMQDYGTDTLSFDELSEHIRILEAATIKPSGEVVVFDKSKVIYKESSTYNTFSNRKKVLIPYSNLRVGSIAIIDYVIEIKRKQLEGSWSTLFYPQNVYPRDQFNLVVKSSDPSHLINWSSTSEYVKCNKTSEILSCEGENIPAERTDDNITWRDIIGQVVVSESSNWEQVINGTQRAFNKSKENMDGVTELLETLIKDKRSTEEKIKAIHRFIVKDVRYISVLKDGHSITPHNLSETINNRYGDCKDKSALLIELLNRIGIKAYPVLVATNRSDVDMLKAPAMTYFDHMVACFKMNNKKMCLDATDSDTGWRDISSWIQGKVSLDLKENSIPSLIPEKRYKWEIDIKTDNVFLDNGDIDEKQKRIYYSEYASNIRGSLIGKRPKQLGRWAVNRYQSINSSKVEPTFDFEGVQELNSNITISSFANYDVSLNTKEELNYSDYDYWLLSEIEAYRVTNKDYATKRTGSNILSEHTFDASGLWKIRNQFPEVNLQHKFGKLKRNVTFNEDKVHLITRVSIPTQKISIEEKQDFNKFIDILKRESAIKVFGSAIKE